MHVKTNDPIIDEIARFLALKLYLCKREKEELLGLYAPSFLGSISREISTKGRLLERNGLRFQEIESKSD